MPLSLSVLPFHTNTNSTEITLICHLYVVRTCLITVMDDGRIAIKAENDNWKCFLNVSVFI